MEEASTVRWNVHILEVKNGQRKQNGKDRENLATRNQGITNSATPGCTTDTVLKKETIHSTMMLCMIGKKKGHNYKPHYQLPEVGGHKKRSGKDDETHMQEPMKKNTCRKRQMETGDNNWIDDFYVKE